ncbi:40S ribosomal protein S12-like [Choloepus didactylus]|uniref:40S ribosomal protein S12-like n=1 Tax=Choloepus didactylus TaxID=27675 RepID=UPI0018A0F254|nr:40S ribosomal protein S12-like [Choloepus didactylus]
MAEESLAVDGGMDTDTALREVLKAALIHRGLAHGICEAAKKATGLSCVLASNCGELVYVKLVEALCVEHRINPTKADDNKKLGDWVGLYKVNTEGQPHKVGGCNCVVSKDYGKKS